MRSRWWCGYIGGELPEDECWSEVDVL